MTQTGGKKKIFMKIRVLVECGIMIALAQILSFLKLYEFPNGGSVDLGMVPIIFFAVRHGFGWGAGAGFVYGFLQYVIGNGFAIDWTTILCDYFIAYTVLGFGAGLFPRKKWSAYVGTLIGGGLRFLAHYIIGAVVWGKWMPETFFGMTMTSPWFYSFLYNGSYMFTDIVICLIVFALLSKPMAKYFIGADLKK